MGDRKKREVDGNTNFEHLKNKTSFLVKRAFQVK